MHKDAYDSWLVKNWKYSKVELQEIGQTNYGSAKQASAAAF